MSHKKFPGLVTPGRHKIRNDYRSGKNTLPNGPSTGCRVSIFTVRINSVFLLGMYTAHKKKFGIV